MDAWEILGIEKGASADEIRAAYSNMVKKFHPEDDPEGFIRIREAYKAAVKMSPGRTATIQKPMPVFDFSQIGEQSSKPEPQKPVFDFSQIDEQALKPEPQKPVFDFSALERDAAELLKEDERIIDGFIAELTALYRSRCKKTAEWKAVLYHPDLEKLKRGEYFTWAFLDFLAITPGIHPKVRAQIIEPFSNELRAYWQGTALWSEFDVSVQKYVSKGLKQAEKIFIFQLLCLPLPIIIFAAAMLFSSSLIPSNENDALGLLTARYQGSLSLVICLAAAVAVLIISQMSCHLRIRSLVNNGVSGKNKIASSFMVLVFTFPAAMIVLSAALNGIPDVTKFSEDIAQISENRLSEDVVYIYKNIRRGSNTDTVLATAAFKSESNLHRDLYIPKALGFSPEPSYLLDDRISIQANLENGMKAYRITYTDNHGMIVSIE